MVIYLHVTKNMWWHKSFFNATLMVQIICKLVHQPRDILKTKLIYLILFKRNKVFYICNKGQKGVQVIFARRRH